MSGKPQEEASGLSIDGEGSGGGGGCDGCGDQQQRKVGPQSCCLGPWSRSLFLNISCVSQSRTVLLKLLSPGSICHHGQES